MPSTPALAHDHPMPRVMRLSRVLDPVQGREWLFPADSASGHLVEHKEDRATLAKWGNDLRQTYRTVAQTVGIADLDIHLLMNHSVVGVNAGYVDRNKLLRDHLRQHKRRSRVNWGAEFAKLPVGSPRAGLALAQSSGRFASPDPNDASTRINANTSCLLTLGPQYNATRPRHELLEATIAPVGYYVAR